MPCCWRRRHRRVREIAWPISAPASVSRALRSPGASPGIDLVLVEIDAVLAELARANAAANAIAAEIIVLDVEADAASFAAAGLGPDSVDAVLMNPPFNDPARHRTSPDKARGIAHVATATTLANWVHAARRILKSRGALTLIWRADGIAEVLAGARSRFREPGDPAGSWRRKRAGQPYPGARHQGRSGADANPSRPDAQ